MTTLTKKLTIGFGAFSSFVAAPVFANGTAPAPPPPPPTTTCTTAPGCVRPGVPIVPGIAPEQPTQPGGGAGGAGGSAAAGASAAAAAEANAAGGAGGSSTLTGGNLSSKTLVLPSVSLPGAAPVAAPNLVITGGGGPGGGMPGDDYSRRAAVCTAFAYEGKSDQKNFYVIGWGSAKGGTNVDKFNTCMAGGEKPKQEDRAFNIADDQCKLGNANTFNAVLGKAGELGDEYAAAMQGTVVCAAPTPVPAEPAVILQSNVGEVAPRQVLRKAPMPKLNGDQ